MPAPDRIVSIGEPINIEGARFYPCLLPDASTWWNPSVTAVLDSTSHKWGLVPWAVKLNRNGILDFLEERLNASEDISRPQMLAALKEARKLPRFDEREKNSAADIGSSAHVWIDWYLHKQLGVIKGREPILLPGAELAVTAARGWLEEVEFEVVSVETTVASRKHDVAGTFDTKGRATIDARGRKSCDAERKMIIPDWKTSTGVFREMKVQNIGYRGMEKENSTNGDCPRGGLILRLRKTEDDPVPLEVVPVPYDEVVWEGFLAARKLWGAYRRLEGKFEGGFRN